MDINNSLASFVVGFFCAECNCEMNNGSETQLANSSKESGFDFTPAATERETACR